MKKLISPLLLSASAGIFSSYALASSIAVEKSSNAVKKEKEYTDWDQFLVSQYQALADKETFTLSHYTPGDYLKGNILKGNILIELQNAKQHTFSGQLIGINNDGTISVRLGRSFDPDIMDGKVDIVYELGNSIVKVKVEKKRYFDDLKDLFNRPRHR